MQNLFFRLLVPIHTWLLRTFKGRFFSSLNGAPVLTLTAFGRKSGQPRTVPLLYVRDGERYVVIASKGGSATDPDWYENLMASGVGTIQLGERSTEVTPEVVTGPERERLWAEAAKIYPQYNDYAKKTSREIPVVALKPMSTDDRRGPVTAQPSPSP
jgi:deazaflavin-dependent oxidoreductase (nitroreductase family)